MENNDGTDQTAKASNLIWVYTASGADKESTCIW